MFETLPSFFALGTVLLITGALAGFAAGLLGVGGGIVIVPILFTALNVLGVESSVTMHTAVGTSLATIIPTSISSALSHHRKGAVDWKLFKAWYPWIICGCLVGTWLANVMASGPMLSGVFGCVALVVAFDLILRNQSPNASPDNLPSSFRAHWVYKAHSAPIPATIGGFSSLMGIGGGTLSVPFLNTLHYPMHRAVGTSAVFGMVIAVPATIGYIWGGWSVPNRPPGSLGYISGYGFILITLTSAAFAPLGAKIAHRLSERALKLMFAGFLFATSIRMLISI